MMKLTCTCIALSTCVAALLAGCGGDVNMLAPATDAAADHADSSTAPDAVADSPDDKPDIDATPDASVDAPPDVEMEEASAEAGLPDSPGDVCGPGQDWCGVCIDIVTNPENCGWCGHECAVGASCSGGHCECPTGTEECAGVCVDPKTDVQHCGGCGQPCAVGAACQGGTCECPSGMDPCAGVCVDESSDVSHCGACGNVCAVGAACESGQCECPAGQAVCSGVCVNLQTDGSNCGACGETCVTGEECGAGACVCLPDWTECNGTCVNLQTDGQNCGACGHDCQGGACDAGWCGPVVLSMNTAHPGVLAADEEHVYWVEQDGGRLWKQEVNGLSPELVSDWSAAMGTLVVENLWDDGDKLYFKYRNDAAGFVRVWKSNGIGQTVFGLGRAFWSSAFSDGQFFFVTSDAPPTGDTILRAALPSMTPSALVLGQPYVRSVAARGGYLYWSWYTAYEGSIARIPVGGGDIKTIASDLPAPDDVAVDDDYVYWIDADGLERLVGTIGQEFPPYGWVETITNGEHVRRYTLSGGDVYAADEFGKIWQLRQTVWPQALEPRATGHPQVRAMAANDCCVFWIGDGDNSITKMVK